MPWNSKWHTISHRKLRPWSPDSNKRASGKTGAVQGTIKGIGRIYQQTAIDTHGSHGFAKVYREKTALTAADLLNDRALPFYDHHGIRVHRVLTDNGPELCGRQDSHPYELFLHLNDIEHTRTKVRHPQTNGAVERLHQTIQNEFYQVAFRRKLLPYAG